MKADEIYEDVIGRCTAVRTLRAARVVTRLYEDALREVDLTITQFTLLVTIGRAKPESISKIGEYLSIDRTTLSRNLKPLEKAGFVTRGAEGEGRRREVRLTRAGLTKLKQAYPVWLTVQNRVEKELGGDEVDDIAVALHRLHSVESILH